MRDINPTLSISTLNVNGLKAPINRQTVWMQEKPRLSECSKGTGPVTPTNVQGQKTTLTSSVNWPGGQTFLFWALWPTFHSTFKQHWEYTVFLRCSLGAYRFVCFFKDEHHNIIIRLFFFQACFYFLCSFYLERVLLNYAWLYCDHINGFLIDLSWITPLLGTGWSVYNHHYICCYYSINYSIITNYNRKLARMVTVLVRERAANFGCRNTGLILICHA